MEKEGHIPLRTYIDTMFEERTNRIVAQLDILEDRIDRERRHLDELMSVHNSMHSHEHQMENAAMERFEQSVTRRLTEMTRTIEKLSDESSKFVRRDTVDERFNYMNEQVRKMEQSVSELSNLVAQTSSRRDANVFFIALGFTALNVLLNVFNSFG